MNVDLRDREDLGAGVVLGGRAVEVVEVHPDLMRCRDGLPREAVRRREHPRRVDERTAAAVIEAAVGGLSCEGDLVREGELDGRRAIDDAWRALRNRGAGEPRDERCAAGHAASHPKRPPDALLTRCPGGCTAKQEVTE